ncbi:molybdopterin-synthase adenylyltransferase MoeB [Tellurirhabdus rosea]|uniref:molybdopterin-synthase adenylyltransferase MoeB n=1 Tax=Tellurirhabdus rosea TaxID=2674997 RepID=UPI00225094B6|nr:molybdopterin-synthase adenylyltransferase MoeB [Tellurirhabdus rosea]
MLLPAETARYQKHLNLPEIGTEGQLKLKQARVLVVGAGGLGCPVLLYLAAAGVGTLGIIDPDTVDISNLQRQVLYTTEQVGQPKAVMAANHLRKLNPEIRLKIYAHALDRSNARTLIDEYDLVIDCTDNFAVRYLVNDACVLLGKPFIYGAIHRFEGQVAVLNAPLSADALTVGIAPNSVTPDAESQNAVRRGPTYRCLFPEHPNQMEIPNCADTGVLGVLPGVIGTYQANEAIKLITGIGHPLSDSLLMVDLLAMSFQKIKVRRRADADAAARRGWEEGIKVGAAAAAQRKITPKELADRLSQGEEIFLLDVRERPEYNICHLEGAVLIPVNIIANNIKRIPADRPVVVYCHHGIRSQYVVDYLQTEHGFTNLKNLQGGIHAWAREVEPEMEVY